MSEQSGAPSQEQFLSILSREEAIARFDAALFPRPLRHETLTLHEALGRTVARDIVAPIDVPPL